MQGKKASNGRRHDAILVIILSILLAGLATPPTVTAEEVVYVDAANTAGPWDGSALYPYQTISEAVAIPDATTIYVAPGVYSENVVITHSLSLIGASSLTTIINGAGIDNTVSAGLLETPMTLNLSGFTLQNSGSSNDANLACTYLSGGIIQGNTIQNGKKGYAVQLDHCTGLTVQNNVISNALFTALNMIICSDCTIHSNTIQQSQSGITISDSLSNIITDNAIAHNTIYGVQLIGQSSQNSFSRNHFSQNSQHAKDPRQNYWSIGQEGNYWDDYTGYDSDGDGIGDTPYAIPEGSNVDAYPLGIFQTSQQGEENAAPIVIYMTISPTEALTGDPVSFVGEGQDSDGIISGYSWESNISGRLSSAKTFTTTSLPAGSHTISFSVQDNDGDWSIAQTSSIVITATAFPVIDGIDPSSAAQYEPINFQGHAENTVGLEIQYQWMSTLDGLLSNASVFTSSTLSCGLHTISLRIKSPGRDWSEPATRQITVEQAGIEDPDQPVVADAGGPYQGSVGVAIHLDASKTTGPVGASLSYSWNFGDGGTGSGKTINHTYAAAGAYSLQLTVVNPEGGSSVSTTMVTVSASSSESSESNVNPLSAMPSLPVFLGVVILVVGILVVVLVWRHRR